MRLILLLTLIVLTINCRSQALRAYPDTFAVPQANTDTFWVTNSDSIPSGESVCIALIDTGERFSVQSCKAIIYNPGPLFTGRDTCRYALCDTAGLCDTTMIVIYVDTNYALLPVAGFKDDSLLYSSDPLLFACENIAGPYAGWEVQLSSISSLADSVSWMVSGSPYDQPPYHFDTSKIFSGDTISFYPGIVFTSDWNSPFFETIYMKVCITAYNQYGSSTYCDSTCFLQYEGISEVPLSNTHIYPDPADKQLTIDMSSSTDAISSDYIAITIYDCLGRQVMNIPHGGRLVEIPVNDMPDGVYIASITGQGGEENMLGRFLVLK